jgi:hypothetical protein
LTGIEESEDEPFRAVTAPLWVAADRAEAPDLLLALPARDGCLPARDAVRDAGAAPAARDELDLRAVALRPLVFAAPADLPVLDRLLARAPPVGALRLPDLARVVLL